MLVNLNQKGFMKTTGCQSLLSVILLFSLHAQAQLATDSLRAPTETNQLTDAKLAGRTGQWRVKQRAAHETEWYSVRYRTNAGTGKVTATTNSYIELATGLNRFEAASGKWEESKEEIEIVPGGAIARKGQHQVSFAANINIAGAIQTTAPDGKVLRSHVLGLAYTDAATGESVLIAQPRDSIGEVIGNQVIYRDAFDGQFRADLRYTYTKAGFEQDVIFRESPPAPEKFGLNSETARLEVWTEFLSPPAPVKTVSLLKLETNNLVRSVMVDPDMTDELLDFGAMRIGTGTAFSIENAASPLDKPAVPVGKDWLRLEGRDFLIEKIDFEDAQPLLQELPAARVDGVKQASFPARRRTAVLASLKGPTMDQDRAQATAKPMRTAAVAPAERGFVLDYLVNLTGNPANMVFKSDTTYYVSGVVNLTGTTTIEGGTVVKYASGTTAYINVQGPLICQTEPYRPAFFTARDDNSVGEIISGSTGVPSGYYGQYSLRLTSGTLTYSLRHLRVRHGYYGIYRFLGSASAPTTIEHSQIQNCYRAVTATSSPLFMRNLLIYRCESGVFSSTSLAAVGENITFHRLGALQSSTSLPALKLTNSLIISCTNYLNYAAESSVHYHLDDAGIFQSSGTAEHYLAAASSYRAVGKVTGNSTFLASLTNTTTHRPLILSGTVGESLVLAPSIVRNSKTAPDIGYAYDAVDFLAQNLVVQGSLVPAITLTLTNGVVVAVDPQAGQAGISFGNYSELVSVGQPGLLNRILPVQMVHEGGSTAANWPSFFRMLHGSGLGIYPNAYLRFTDISMPSGPYYVMGYWNGGFIKLTFQDSQVRGGTMYLGSDNQSQSIALMNTCWDRVSFTHHPYAPGAFDVRNNLFKGGALYLDMNPAGAPVWTFHDNLFDGTLISQTGGPAVENNYNAYVHTAQNSTRLSPSPGSGDVILTASPVYEAGTFGSYYLPATATSLINQGSRIAAAAGLFHYTTSKILGSVESTELPAPYQVNIGLHYAAVDADGKALDSDGDGIANIFEDIDGDGSKAATETHFADVDSDYDGRNDWQELFEDNTNPNDGSDAKPVSLGYWQFNDTSWLGDGGQTPMASSVLESLANQIGWSGNTLGVQGASPASLKYRDVETGGAANINLRRGTLSFWFQPNWTSSSVGSGTGPGQIARLIESGNTVNTADGWWSVSISASGEHLLFESQIGGPGNRIIYFSSPISWVARQWHQITLAYSQTETKLYIDGQLMASGVGIQSYPTSAARGADGFSIGSNRSGGERSMGQFDELQTFNHVLPSESVTELFEMYSAADADFDGLSDIRENEFGADPSIADTDGDGLSDGDEVNVHFTDVLDPDTDYDGRSDWQEVNEDLTNPFDSGSVAPVELARFSFDGAEVIGRQGQVPIAVQNVSLVSSWSGTALKISENGPARLAYDCLNPNSYANLNCQEGTIQFWFKPAWSSGVGAGQIARLIEVGDASQPGNGWWAWSFTANGSGLLFEGMAPNSTQAHVFLDDTFGSVSAGQWYLFTFTYSAADSRVYLNGALVALGNGVDAFPNLAGRSEHGFSIGSDRSGGARVEGQFEELSTYNYELASTEIAAAYLARIDMSLPNYTVRIPEYANTSTVLVEVDGAPGSTITWDLNSTPVDEPPANPTWVPLESFELTNLQPGEYELWVGLKDSNNSVRWVRSRLVIDVTPPQVVITSPQVTNPSGTLITRPLIQLQGHGLEKLSSVSYWIANSAGTSEEMEGQIMGDVHGNPTTSTTPSPMPGNNYTQTYQPYLRTKFQCFDIDLLPGNNELHLRVKDLAGNETLETVIYVLDYSQVSTGPAVLSQWPQAGWFLSGESMSLAGYLDDPTATIKATVTVNGEPVDYPGVVERDGLFWIEGVPLNAGNNSVTLSSGNAAGYTSVQSLNVNGSPVTITMTSHGDITKDRTEVAGHISASGYSMWVNGVQATVDASGNWSATGVPAWAGGTTSFQVTAVPDGEANTATSSGNGLNNVQSPNPTSPNAIHARFDVERPAFIRISRYEGSARSYTGSWDVCEIATLLSDSSWTCAWRYGADDSIQIVDKWTQDCAVNALGNPVPVDHFLHQEVTWDAAGNGTGLSDPPGGVAIPRAPDWPWEHCENIRADWYIGEQDHHFQRSAQTHVELHTGGKSLAGEKNLIVISGGFTGRDAGCAQFGGPTFNAGEVCADYAVDLSTVQIPQLGKSFGGDGRLYVALPDNQIIDVTPKVPQQDFYHYSMEVSKHRPVLKANGVDMQPNKVVDGVKFCVGQKVAFTYGFEPLLSGVMKADQIWSLPGNYVNDYWPLTIGGGGGGNVPGGGVVYIGSKNYFKNFDRLILPSTSAWWVEGGKSLGIRLAANVQFANRQAVTILGKGLIDMHRPTARPRPVGTFGAPWFQSPRGPKLDFASIGGIWEYGIISLNNKSMNFFVEVHSDFSGKANYVQLVEAINIGDIPKWKELMILNTHDEFYLDTSNPYNAEWKDIPAGGKATPDFYDGPAVPGISYVSINMNFKAYCVFRPSGTESIPITLALVTWSWTLEAERFGASWNLGTDVITSICPPPIFQESSEFPYWNKVATSGVPNY